MNTAPALPFPALVGLDMAQQALLLLAVEPRLRGVVFAAPAGAGKSSLARGFRALAGMEARSMQPFVELPLNTDEEGLLGGLDMEATIRTGKRIARPGVLARADGGVLYVDELHLLPDTIATLLLAALESGDVHLEREGLSMRYRTRFSVLGAYDPSEGQPRRHLLDRVGLIARLPRTASAQERVDVLDHNLRVHPTQWDAELELLQGLVRAAREQLPHVRIDDEQIEHLAAAAIALGVEGHRADLFAVRAACASAALALRDAVEWADLELAVRLVMLPRATRQPDQDTQRMEQQPPTDTPEDRQAQQEQAADGTSTAANVPSSDEPSNDEAMASVGVAPPNEQVLSALVAELPEALTDLPFRTLRRGRGGSRGATLGKRGRHIRSASGDPRRARIDIIATLRAAAPWQRVRGLGTGGWELGQETELSSPRLILRGEDLRVKHYRSKAGTLFCFVVDASGSMALHRMRQAKGAVHALLQQAYVHRDRVALVAFRGNAAELLLPPSQSVELARRALDLLPTGGGTPLAAGLLHALNVAHQARSRGILQTVFVLLTDGRANVGIRPQTTPGRAPIEEELQRIGRHVVAAGIQSIVVDTQRHYLSRGEARRVAEWLCGRYVYLPNASGDQIAHAALAARTVGDTIG